MKKTEINLDNYDFGPEDNPKFQISDSPVNKLARVIEIKRAGYLMDIGMISIEATTHYINPELGIIVFCETTRVEQKAWNIAKGDQTIKVDENTFQPLPNPEFDKTQPIDRETNYPYQLTDAYEQFKDISVKLLMPMLILFVAGNDQKGLFD